MWFQAAAERHEARFRDLHRAQALRAADRLPASFQRHIGAGWDARYGIQVDEHNRSPVLLANTFAREAVAAFGDARCGKAYDEGEIRALAENYSTLCSRMGSLESCRSFGRDWFNIEPPKAQTPAGERARWECPLWWRRQLRKVWTRAAEDAMRAAGINRKGRAPYVSDEAVRHHAARAERMREWLSSRVMENESGEQLEMLELHKHSLANPALRRGEFMCRVRGFEELADSLGHVALFFTLTTPSRFHAQLSVGGVNPAWEAERATVRAGQAWLRDMWNKARAELARKSIMYYGIRVAEPHHDGTPHWHAILWVSPHDAQALQVVIREHWLSDAGGEPGAREFRAKCITIDRERGSAVGYVAKYIAKNIDAAGAIGEAESDEAGGKVKDTAHRVAAWASVHGIRQFQQVGGPPVGLWREARRLREAVAPALIESVRAPASERGSWAEFIGALGGIERARRRTGSMRSTYRRTLKVPKVPQYRAAKRQGKGPAAYRAAKRQPAPEVFTAIVRERRRWTRVVRTTRDARPDEMPAVWLDKGEALTRDPQGREVIASTRYGEPPGPRPAGLCSFGLLGRFNSADTRSHRWRIERKSGCEVAGVRARQATAQSARTLSFSESDPHVMAALERGRSWSARASALFSGLGPVAITVRGDVGPASGDPMAWTSRETSTAGPEWLQ